MINARSERSLLGCGVTNDRSSIRIGFTRSMRAEIWNAVRSRLQNATSILSFFFFSFHLNSSILSKMYSGTYNIHTILNIDKYNFSRVSAHSDAQPRKRRKESLFSTQVQEREFLQARRLYHALTSTVNVKNAKELIILRMNNQN